MRSRRSVTLPPIGMPSRTLKVAIDLRARVIAGFCPAILARSASAAVTFLVSLTASPTPMLTTILSIARHFHRVLVAELLDQLPADGLAIERLQPRLVFGLSHRSVLPSAWR